MKSKGDAIMWLFYAGCFGWLAKILWDEHQRDQRAHREYVAARIRDINIDLGAIKMELHQLTHPEAEATA